MTSGTKPVALPDTLGKEVVSSPRCLSRGYFLQGRALCSLASSTCWVPPGTPTLALPVPSMSRSPGNYTPTSWAKCSFMTSLSVIVWALFLSVTQVRSSFELMSFRRSFCSSGDQDCHLQPGNPCTSERLLQGSQQEGSFQNWRRSLRNGLWVWWSGK